MAAVGPEWKIGGLTEHQVLADTRNETEQELAALLLEVHDIATKEVDTMDGGYHLWSSDDEEEDDEELPTFPKLAFRKESYICSISPRVRTLSMEDTHHPKTRCDPTPKHLPSRVRTVSIDSPFCSQADKSREAPASPVMTTTTIGGSSANIVSPHTSPVQRGTRRVPSPIPLRKSTRCRRVSTSSSSSTMLGKAADKLRRKNHHDEESSSLPTSPKSPSMKSGRPVQPRVVRGNPLKTILRKKFSWKNYPEVSETIPKICQTLFSLTTTPFITLFTTVGSLFDCQPRRVSSSLGSQLHDSTKAVQQSLDRTTLRTRRRSWLRL